MKKIDNLYKHLFVLLLSSIIIISCDQNDDEDFPDPTYAAPVVELSDNGAELGVGQFINITVGLKGSVALTTFQIKDGNTVLEQFVFPENSGAYDDNPNTDGNQDFPFLFRVPADWLGTTRNLEFSLNDRLGNTKIETFSITVSEIVPQYTIEDVTIDGQAYKEISGIVNFNETLTSDNLYLINGFVEVSQQTTLMIEAGTTIYGKDAKSRLNINEFGTITADGTLENPIVFTSFETAQGQSGNPDNGDWSGIQINGSGAGDNSGIFRYVRVEYGGSDNDTFQLSNVGDQTIIEYVQVFKSLDNAFRVNEGNVNLRYIVATDSEDAGVRFDDGWMGNGQFWVVNTTTTSTAIEGRDQSNTVLSNITITGIGFNDTPSPPDGDGIRIRNEAKARIYNTIVTGVDRSIRFSDGSEAFTTTGENVFRNSASFNNDSDGGTGFHSSADLFNPTDGDYDPVNNNSIDPFTITDSYVGVSTANSRAAGGLSSFFEDVNYIGAVPVNNDWTLGWTLNMDGSLRE